MRIVSYSSYGLTRENYRVSIPINWKTPVYVPINNELVALRLKSIEITDAHYTSWCGHMVEAYDITYNCITATGKEYKIIRGRNSDNQKIFKNMEDYLNWDGENGLFGNNPYPAPDVRLGYGLTYIQDIYSDYLESKNIKFDLVYAGGDSGYSNFVKWGVDGKQVYTLCITCDKITITPPTEEGQQYSIQVDNLNVPKGYCKEEYAKRHRTVKVVEFED